MFKKIQLFIERLMYRWELVTSPEFRKHRTLKEAVQAFEVRKQIEHAQAMKKMAQRKWWCERRIEILDNKINQTKEQNNVPTNNS